MPNYLDPSAQAFPAMPPMPSGDTGMDWGNALTALGLGLGSVTGGFGQDHNQLLGQVAARQMTQQQETAGFREASQGIAWASQASGGDAAKEMQLLGRFLQESGINSPVALKMVTARMEVMQQKANESMTQRMGTDTFRGFQGQQPGGFTPPPAGLQTAQAGPALNMPWKEDWMDYAVGRGMTDKQAADIATLRGLKSKYEIPFDVSKAGATTTATGQATEALAEANKQAVLARTGATTRQGIQIGQEEKLTPLADQGRAVDVTQAGATEGAQLEAKGKYVTESPTAKAEREVNFSDFRRRGIQTVQTKSDNELEDLIGPVGEARIAWKLKMDEAEMPAKQAMVDYQKKATRQINDDKVWIPSGGQQPFDKHTGKALNLALTEGMLRDPKVMANVKLLTSNERIVNRRLNEADAILSGIEDVMGKITAGGAGLSTQARTELQKVLGEGFGKQLDLLVNALALVEAPAVTGQMRPLQQSYANIVKASPTSRDYPDVVKRFVKTQRDIYGIARDGLFDREIGNRSVGSDEQGSGFGTVPGMSTPFRVR